MDDYIHMHPYLQPTAIDAEERQQRGSARLPQVVYGDAVLQILWERGRGRLVHFVQRMHAVQQYFGVWRHVSVGKLVPSMFPLSPPTGVHACARARVCVGGILLPVG